MNSNTLRDAIAADFERLYWPDHFAMPKKLEDGMWVYDADGTSVLAETAGRARKKWLRARKKDKSFLQASVNALVQQYIGPWNPDNPNTYRIGCRTYVHKPMV